MRTRNTKKHAGNVHAEFIPTHDPRWNNILARTQHDVYQLASYTELCAHKQNAEPIAFYAERDNAVFLAPLLVRTLPEHLNAPSEWRDAITCYGYAAPLLISSDQAYDLRLFLSLFRQLGQDHNLITAFFRMHPLLELSPTILSEFGDLIYHGETITIDLTQPYHVFWSNMRENHKRDIRKLRNANFRASMDCWEYFPVFRFIYTQTMQRVDANSFYFFDDTYFSELRHSWRDTMHLCTVFAPNGDVAAAGLFTVVNGIVQYHLGATNSTYLRNAPSKLMFDHVCRWAQTLQCHVLHLGGGVGCQDDSLFRFKSGFSKSRRQFCTFRMVIDAERNNNLIAQWRAQNGHDQTAADSLFFPHYRRAIHDISVEPVNIS